MSTGNVSSLKTAENLYLECVKGVEKTNPN